MTRRDHAALLVVLIGLTGCGGEDEAPPPVRPNAAKPAAAAPAAGAAGAAGAMRTYPRIEDRVTAGERATIRRAFRDTDFQPDLAGNERRDPFRSYVILKDSLLADDQRPLSPSELCTQKQLVASNYSLRDMKLVGIVARGPTRRYALFQDTANVGHKVLVGDCLGSEKARVKQIGDRTITLEIASDAPTVREPEERSIELYPDELRPTKLDDDDDERGRGRATVPRVPVAPTPAPSATPPATSSTPAPGAP